MNSRIHWELEYPAVFFGEDGEKISEAGFDAVIGNPPYVRMEQIKPLKPFLASKYRVHDSRVDLYAYFMERSLQLTRNKYGVIVSNKWMKSQYGENLRNRLSKYRVEQLLDFGDLEVFEDVSTYPCVLIVNSDNSSTGDVLVHQFDSLDFSSLREVVSAGGSTVSSNSFSSEKWSIGTADQEKLKGTLESGSVPLSEYLYEITQNETIGDGIGRGIVTGGNDAFVIDSDTKEKLIAEDPESAQFIKPLLKGTDIERYRVEDNDRYLIYIKKGTNLDQYPAIEEYLSQYKEQIGSTATDEEWYELQQAQAEYEAFFESVKICYPDIAKECSFAMDEKGQYLANTCYFIPSDSYAILGVLNSGPINWYYQFTTSEYRGGYQRSFTHAIRNIPIPEGVMEATRGKDEENLASLARELTDLHERRHSLNLDLLDYLGNYQEGSRLPDIGLYQPAGASDSVLNETSEDNDNHLRLRIGDVRVTRKGKGTVLVEATARYRPDENENFVETEWKPAFRLTDLTETEVSLVEAFVPVAADEAGGFAGYREKATKTNTLIDRIEAITLPNPGDVVEGLERYMDAFERAEELDKKIQRTDDLIDEIVYDLYGLSSEEVDVIEDAVNEN